MNYRSDRDTKLEILLNKICIASRHFEIRELLGQVDSQDLSQPLLEISEASSLKIGWQERVTLHYLVVPIETENTAVAFSTLSFSSGNNVVSSESATQTNGVTDFMCRERAHEVFIVSLAILLSFLSC